MYNSDASERVTTPSRLAMTLLIHNRREGTLPMATKKTLIRVNTRIGHNQNEWLDKMSENTGISKSGLIQLAVESYMAQKQSVTTLGQLITKLDSLEQSMNKLQE